MTEHTPFLTVFPGCAARRDSCGGLDKAYITDVQVNLAERRVTVSAWFPAMPSPVEEEALCACLRDDYALNSVRLIPDYPQPRAVLQPFASSTPSSAPKGDVLFGRAIKQSPVKMDTLNLESGCKEYLLFLNPQCCGTPGAALLQHRAGLLPCLMHRGGVSESTECAVV